MYTRKEVIGDCTLYLGDSSVIIPTLGKIGSVVSDPPYGIAFSHGGNDRSGIGKGQYSTKFANVKIEGDAEPFDPSHLVGLADDVILWGGNHFANRLPSSSCWLIWDKRAASGHTNDFADCEIAWTNRKGVARVFRHHWDGMMKASERGQKRLHPTQKPVALMAWCLTFVGGGIVLDPYMGSGSTGVACMVHGKPFIGIEIDEGYFEAACERMRKEHGQVDMFAAPPALPSPVAETSLFGEIDP